MNSVPWQKKAGNTTITLPSLLSQRELRGSDCREVKSYFPGSCCHRQSVWSWGSILKMSNRMKKDKNQKWWSQPQPSLQVQLLPWVILAQLTAQLEESLLPVPTGAMGSSASSFPSPTPAIQEKLLEHQSCLTAWRKQRVEHGRLLFSLLPKAVRMQNNEFPSQTHGLLPMHPKRKITATEMQICQRTAVASTWKWYFL